MDSTSVAGQVDPGQVDSISAERRPECLTSDEKSLVSSRVPLAECVSADCRNTDVPSHDEDEQRMPAQEMAAAGSDEFVPINVAEIKNIGLEVSDEQARQFRNDITRLSPVTVGLREKTLEEVSLTPETCSVKRPLIKAVDSSQSSENQLPKQLKVLLSRFDDKPSPKRKKLNEEEECQGSPCRRFTVEKLGENEQIKLQDGGEALKVTMTAARQVALDVEMCELGMPLNRKLEFQDETADTEETESASDSSELVAASGSQIEFHDCENSVELSSADPNNLENDPLGCEDIIRRLEPERPEEFTEDSAESLALATSARDEVRSDGSDSGLGSEIPGDSGPTPAPESDSETLFLDRIQDDILQKNKQKEQRSPQMSLQSYPQKSNLKRRLTDCTDDGPSAKRLADEPAKKKRSIQFDAVTVYYFPRAQGFTCVPSQGGSTLGMSATHTHAERFSLTEHAAEQRRLHRARLAQLRSERASNCVTEGASSSEDPSDDTDEEPTDTEDIDIDSYYFLQPVPTWQRRALLRAAGVRRIDTLEKDECRDIRASREHCGCACKGYCDPESCPCSRANVKCQVDRAGFPCGCSRDGCANSSGRIEFNPVRVRTHFIHTLMRLEIEKKQREEEQNDNDTLDRGCTQDIGLGSMLDSTQDNSQSGNVNVNGNVDGAANAGFADLHYNNGQENRNGSREDSLDLYAMRDDCYANNETIENSSSQRKNGQPEFGQTSFPSFTNPSVSFQQNAYTDYTSYQTLPSTSSANFQCRAFAPYNSPYVHATAGYDAPFVDETSESQYTNLNSVQQPMNAVVQQMNKLEPFSELLAGRYSYYSEVESQGPVTYSTKSEPEREESLGLEIAQKPEHESEIQRDDNPDDCDENFGEIIKKSMVETVSA